MCRAIIFMIIHLGKVYRRFYKSSSDILNIIKDSILQKDELNLYFHFPFCKNKCAFCNLFTISDVSDSRFKEYFSIIKKEFLFYEQYIANKRVNTIYLGGGTPSWIPAEYFIDLFQVIESAFDIEISSVEEVSIELSPETTEVVRLQSYYDAGINRVNIGIQSVDGDELSCSGRSHKNYETHTALKNLMDIGFKNVCIDLIYGLEG